MMDQDAKDPHSFKAYPVGVYHKDTCHKGAYQKSACPVRLGQQQGIALISMLLLFVMVVSLAVAMIDRQELTMKRANNTLQKEDLREVALGVEANIREMVISLLERAAKFGQKDKVYVYFNPLGYFAGPLPVLDEYDVALHISDPQGRLNLNDLQHKNKDRRRMAETIFRTLLSDLNFENPDAFMQEAKHWLDNDLNLTDSDYESRDIPHKAGHQAFVHFSELSIFEQLTEKDRLEQKLNRLSLYVDAYPNDNNEALNVNTACKRLLKALFKDCSGCLQDVTEARDGGIEQVPTGFMQKGFKEKDSLLKLGSLTEYYKPEDEAQTEDQPGKVNTSNPANSLNTSNQRAAANKPPKWPKEDLGVMTNYLDLFIRVQRKGTVNQFVMKTRFKLDSRTPNLEIVARNYSPVQPITLANQRLCIDE